MTLLKKKISSWLRRWLLSFTTSISRYSVSLQRKNIVDASLKLIVMYFDLQYIHYNIYYSSHSSHEEKIGTKPSLGLPLRADCVG